MAYIYYNPVKHGFVERPLDWEYSPFTHREQAIYPNVSEIPKDIDALAARMSTE